MFGRGWSITYGVHPEQDETELSMSLALEGLDGRRVGMHTITAKISPMLPSDRLSHIVGMYDGFSVSLYVDGMLEALEQPCGVGVHCGKILYPTQQV